MNHHSLCYYLVDGVMQPRSQHVGMSGRGVLEGVGAVGIEAGTGLLMGEEGGKGGGQEAHE